MPFFDQANVLPLPAASLLSIFNGGKAHTIPVKRITKPEFKMLSAVRLVETPSSLTSSKNNMPTEGIRKKIRHANRGKQRPRTIEGGTTNAKIPSQQCKPACTELKGSTRCNVHPTPNIKTMLHERLPKPKSTLTKDPSSDRL
ncbi:hypothetical protein EZV62_007851 [Acer yangbiense]|uniref:Uncharacterized protein n=1 Tax=Acer yangbiense TaxID=1000413 RepID=A0A5C7IDV2_9ROSI|nr:hypothetical protein EZV62_007851 [Acer yangbiense]